MNKSIVIDSRALDVARLTGDKFTRLMAWADLQLQAAEAPAVVYVRGEKINMQRGQVLTTIKELATRWNTSRQTANKYLEEYRTEGRLTLDEHAGLVLLTCSDETCTVQTTTVQQADDTTEPPQRPNRRIGFLAEEHVTTEQYAIADDTSDAGAMEAWTHPEEVNELPNDYPTTPDIADTVPDQTEKHRYAEGVELTLSEYNDIVSTFGVEDAFNIIELASQRYVETGSPYLDAHNSIMQDFAPQYFAAKKNTDESSTDKQADETLAAIDEQPSSDEPVRASTTPTETAKDIPPVIKVTPAPVPKKVPKKMYAENVKMTESEYNNLVERYSEEGARWMITKLDNYKAARGMVYKSDYRAILNWVVKEWQKELKAKQNGNYNGSSFRSATELAEEQSDAAFAEYYAANYGQV